MSDLAHNDYALLSTAYLPPVDYFRVMRTHGGFVIESHENYQKQSYRNRCCIYSANGVMPLVIPIVRSGGKQLITEVRIDYTKEWQKQHWGAIYSAYKSTPFFDYYQNDIYPFYSSVKEESLFELNNKLFSIILDILNFSSTINCTSDYKEESPNDFRNSIHPKRESPITPNSRLSVNITDTDRNPHKYHQLFSHKYGFAANLSIIDLLFNEGPDSILYL